MIAIRALPICMATIAAASCSGDARLSAQARGGAVPRGITLSIVATTDVHGGILQREDGGGLALLGGYLANLRAARAADGGGVLLVDAGDMFQGTLESNLNEGAVVVQAYNALGYSAAAIGNHEFDFGPVGPASSPQAPADDPRGALKARAAEARFPFLAANLIDTAIGQPVAWPNVRPSVVVTSAGVRVGIIGVMTERALSGTLAANTGGLRVAPLADTIAAEARRLRDAGASVVVVAAHAGGLCRDFADADNLSSCDLSEEIVRVAQALPRGAVDVIGAGHRHAGMAHEIANIAIVEAFSGGRAFSRVDLTIDRRSKAVVARRVFSPRDLCERVDAGSARCAPPANPSRAMARYEGRDVHPDPAIVRILQPAVTAADALKSTPLGVTAATIIHRGTDSESPLGNLFTDAYLTAIPNADVSLHNIGGGLRADLPAGPVTYGGIFEVMPFDNRVVGFHLNGRDLRKLVASLVQSRFPALPGISGIRVRALCEGGAVRITLSKANGAEVRDDERLLVATVDFLATGGDGVFASIAPRGGFATEVDGGTARDAVVNVLRKRGGTLTEDQLVDSARPHWMLPGPRPVVCR